MIVMGSGDNEFLAALAPGGHAWLHRVQLEIIAIEGDAAGDRHIAERERFGFERFVDGSLMAGQIADASGLEQLFGHVLLDVNHWNRGGALAESPTDSRQQLRAVMRRGM